MSNLPTTWPAGVVAVTQRYFLPPGAQPVVHALQLERPSGAATLCGKFANESTALVEPDAGRLCSICAGRLAGGGRPFEARPTEVGTMVPTPPAAVDAKPTMTWSEFFAAIERMTAQLAEVVDDIEEIRRRDNGDFQ